MVTIITDFHLICQTEFLIFSKCMFCLYKTKRKEPKKTNTALPKVVKAVPVVSGICVETPHKISLVFHDVCVMVGHCQAPVCVNSCHVYKSKFKYFFFFNCRICFGSLLCFYYCCPGTWHSIHWPQEIWYTEEEKKSLQRPIKFFWLVSFFIEIQSK